MQDDFWYRIKYNKMLRGKRSPRREMIWKQEGGGAEKGAKIFVSYSVDGTCRVCWKC